MFDFDVFFKRKEKIEKYICKKQEKYAHMKSLNWRVDVGISSSSVLKLIVATVVFQVETSDGRVYCFEVPLNKFHLLRFSVAQALKEIDDLLNRNVLKIYDWIFDIWKQFDLILSIFYCIYSICDVINRFFILWYLIKVIFNHKMF